MVCHGRTAALAAAIALGTACGGTVETSGGPGTSGSGGTTPAAGGAGGSDAGVGGYGGPSMGGWAGNAGTSPGGSPGWGGSAGTTPVDGGPDVQPSCGRTHEAFQVAVYSWEGKTYGCGFGSDTGTLKLQGSISGGDEDTFVLDSCPPNADCMPMLSKIYLPGSYAWIPPGTFVTLQLDVQQPWGCLQRMLIMNLPVWGGEPNPNGGEASMLFAAADGTYETFPESPFGIAAQPLGCYPGAPGCGGETPDDYMLLFFEMNSQDNMVTVPMGNGASWWLSNGSLWYVQNLRSYASGACDDYWNWSYRITMQGIK
jgi:hypothetical protein